MTRCSRTVGLSLGVFFATIALSSPALADATSGSCPNSATAGFRPYLPDCRAYEMVSPPFKEGFSARGVAVSDTGSELVAESLGGFVTSEGATTEGTGLFGHSYRLVRGEDGWQETPLDAPSARFPNFEAATMSADLESSLWFATVPGRSPADVYLETPAVGSPGEVLTYVGPGTPPAAAEIALDFLGASSNLSHSLFLVDSPRLGLEEDRLWPGDTTFPERLPSLYEYAGTNNDEPRLVGVKDEHRNDHVIGSQLISNCGTVLGSASNPGGDVYNAISSSGGAIFFTAEACGAEGPPVNELYARVDQEKTVDISEPALSVPERHCGEPCAAAENTPALRKPGIFAGASLDGSKVFFMTQQSLVDEDEAGSGLGMDLYEADMQGDAVTRLTQISRGGAGDPTPGSDAGVLGVARVSEDGSHVYFVAEGVLTGANREGKSPSQGAKNLYVFARECPGGEAACPDPGEHTAFIATLSPEDEALWALNDVRPAQATPDGRFLVFQSKADLTSDQGTAEEAGQVFEYDARTETLVRASQGQNGFDENGNSSEYAATIPVQDYEVDRPSTHFTHLAVSADGSRVYFLSRDALTPQATVGVLNVYQYHDAQVDLISDGHDMGVETDLIGTDETGRNVFFTTSDSLLPQDVDTQVDIYDARVEGGFPRSAELAPCATVACRGPASEPLVVLSPLSMSASAESAAGPVVASVVVKHKMAKHETVKKKPKRRRRRAGGRGLHGSRGKGASKTGGRRQ